MKCSYCGTEFNGNFCPGCGARAETNESSTPIKQSIQQEKTTSPTEEEIVSSSKSKRKKKKPIYKKWWIYVILAVALIALIGSISGREKTVKIRWGDMILGEQLAVPPKSRGKIYINSAERLWIEIEKVNNKQFYDYTVKCAEKGFTVDAESDSLGYKAYNADGYGLSVTYYDSMEKMSIDLEKPMVMSTISWPNSEAGNRLPVPQSEVGNYSWEYENSFYVHIGNTSREEYNDYVMACADMGFSVDYKKSDDHYYAYDRDGWYISLNYEGNNTMGISIKAPESNGNATQASLAEATESTGEQTEAATVEPYETEQLPTETIAETSTNDTNLIDGMHKDFKEAMDSYEEFMDEYVVFMKKFDENPGDIGLLGEYAKYMAKYADAMDKFDKWESEDLNGAEMAYYIDVQARVSKKLMEAAQ